MEEATGGGGGGGGGGGHHHHHHPPHQQHHHDGHFAAAVGTGAAKSVHDHHDDKRIISSETCGHGATSQHGMQPQAIFGYCIMRSTESSPSSSLPNTRRSEAPLSVESSSGPHRRDYVTAEVRKISRGQRGGGDEGGGGEEEEEEEEVVFFGVFDEHGEGRVGLRLAETLLDAIATGLGSDPAGATRDAYLRTDRRLVLEAGKGRGPAGGGATAVTAMVLHSGARLIVANVGDARAVLCRDGKAVQLSVDHVASRPAERAGVEMRGGHVITYPGDLPRVDGMLSVTRVFGDASLKGHLSAKPDVSDILLDISCQFLVLGSNGLWVAFSDNQEVIDLVKSMPDPLAASKFLVKEARSRGSFDEISCIVIRFKEV